MEEKSIKVSFITVNFNGIQHTANLLETIFKQAFEFPFEVIVVDNGSTQNEYDALKMMYPNIKGGYQPHNLGFAGGNNVGINLAKGKYFYFLNNDTLLPNNAGEHLQAMMEFCTNRPEVGGLSPKLIYKEPAGLIQFAGSTPLSRLSIRNKQIGYKMYDQGQFDQIREIPYFHGAAMFVPKAVVDKVGVLPICFFLYYEELDWSCSITKYYKLFYFPEASIVHLESASTGLNSPFKTFYLTRSRLIFAYRQRRGLVRWLALIYLTFVASIISLSRYIVKAQSQHIKSYLKGLFSAYIWILNLKR
jgi:GT2 family glycosyltransferase